VDSGEGDDEGDGDDGRDATAPQVHVGSSLRPPGVGGRVRSHTRHPLDHPPIIA